MTGFESGAMSACLSMVGNHLFVVWSAGKVLVAQVVEASPFDDLVINVRHIHYEFDVVVEMSLHDTPQHVHGDIVTGCREQYAVSALNQHEGAQRQDV